DQFFPKELQDKLHAELIARKRLSPPEGKHSPLVAYFYGGATAKNGKRVHHLTIESKISHTTHKHHHREARHRTRFTFDDSGTEIEVLD
ncbi:MAG: hypothetical protein ACREML_06655, partial [Vulcanimicrobiaceae bacterium]